MAQPNKQLVHLREEARETHSVYTSIIKIAARHVTSTWAIFERRGLKLSGVYW